MSHFKALCLATWLGTFAISLPAIAHQGHHSGGVTDYVYPATSTVTLNAHGNWADWYDPNHHYIQPVHDIRPHRPHRHERMTKKRRQSLARIKAVNDRQARQSRRINRAYNNHKITHRQYKRLRREQAKIQRLEADMRRDHHLSQYEKNILWQKLNKANKNIKRAIRR